MAAINIANQYDDGRLQPRDPDAVIEWEVLTTHLAGGLQAWLTVVDADHLPSVRPVLAVFVDGALHTASSTIARKTEHLSAGSPATLATSVDGLDVVWSGIPTRVTDADELDRIVAAYRDTHGWDVWRSGEALAAPYGAPTAGPPPYLAFRIEPTTIYAFGTVEGLAERSTRWELGAYGGTRRS
jgi:hypothetical protein